MIRRRCSRCGCFLPWEPVSYDTTGFMVITPQESRDGNCYTVPLNSVAVYICRRCGTRTEVPY